MEVWAVSQNTNSEEGGGHFNDDKYVKGHFDDLEHGLYF